MNAPAKWVKPIYKEFAELPHTKRISAAAFAQSRFFTYCPSRCFSATILVDGDDVRKLATQHQGDKDWILVVAFEMYDGTGFAMTNDYWSKEIFYWTFGCRHEHKTGRNVGNCLNEYTCSDCGYAETIDSSG